MQSAIKWRWAIAYFVFLGILYAGLGRSATGDSNDNGIAVTDKATYNAAANPFRVAATGANAIALRVTSASVYRNPRTAAAYGFAFGLQCAAGTAKREGVQGR